MEQWGARWLFPMGDGVGSALVAQPMASQTAVNRLKIKFEALHVNEAVVQKRAPIVSVK